MIPLPPGSTLFPYTTLFRSEQQLTLHAPREVGDVGTRKRDLRAVQAARGKIRRGTCRSRRAIGRTRIRSEEHTSELQSPVHLVCRLLLEKKNQAGQGGPLSR